MARAPIYNIKLSVRSLSESISFYKRVFNKLGFNNATYWNNDPYENADTWTFSNGRVYLELQEVSEDHHKSEFDCRRTGLYRIEFLAESKQQVDEFHQHLLENRVDIIRGPEKMYEGYIGEDDSWYAVYFKDINGIIFGFVFTPKDIE